MAVFHVFVLIGLSCGASVLGTSIVAPGWETFLWGNGDSPAEREQQTAYSLSFSVPFAVVPIVLLATLFARSFRQTADASAGASEAGTALVAYSDADDANRDTPEQKKLIHAPFTKPRLQRIGTALPVLQMVGALLLLAAAFVGLILPWASVQADSNYGSYVWTFGLRSVVHCSPGYCTTRSLWAAVGERLEGPAASVDDYYTDTFTAGLAVTALLSASLAFSLYILVVNFLLAVPCLAGIVRGLARRLAPFMIVVPWALVIAASIVWWSSAPYGLLADMQQDFRPQGTVAMVPAPANVALTGAAVIFGLVVFVIAIVDFRAMTAAQHGHLSLKYTSLDSMPSESTTAI